MRVLFCILVQLFKQSKTILWWWLVYLKNLKILLYCLLWKLWFYLSLIVLRFFSVFGTMEFYFDILPTNHNIFLNFLTKKLEHSQGYKNIKMSTCMLCLQISLLVSHSPCWCHTGPSTVSSISTSLNNYIFNSWKLLWLCPILPDPYHFLIFLL